jgi:hypothetical protein
LFNLVNRIKMDFSATRISTQDFTPEQIKSILADAKQQIDEEQQPIKSKKDIICFQ